MRVLITGATGLIGSKISRLCREKGIEVHYLSTSKDKLENKTDYKGFYWNPNENEIDSKAIEGVDTIINLVGASIAERWTPEQKKKILKSRTETANLLYTCLQENEHEVKNLLSASAIGIYPSSLEKLYTEEDQGVDDSFVGEVVVKWEEAVDNFKDLGIEVAKIRIGLVLAKNGGMLQKLKEPVNFNVGSPLGNGKQWQSWIHIDDISGIFMFALEKELTGVYNAVAPNPVTNKELVNEVASQMGKPVWLPNVPKVALKLVLGEMSRLVLSSQLVSSDKIEQEGYIFKYVNLSKALEDLI
ncbi:TIGR01777 family oxidoreductase [Salegentibacter agarivorans]|uniref:TIGR01777 family oxidoreductase n=1 Tax=Salegentibacter sp. BDJ18 TaxID=2816376 RepID=UPI001AAED226|nr:TIGR01777 family oxidoreductase [Salegentibacter sp. BDJ18]MBO2544481.1 TIGR01777 family oxidoreductase [Salegentibacter sp. BDJ18]|tara:strand:- start:992 stop:1894 length:903 start_codon:yes stop_codon:yes gene_type:complete